MKIEVNGKSVNIPDKEIEKLKKSLDISTEDAIEIWLDDNNITVNEEQIALDDKAKKVKIDHSTDGKPRKKSDKPKTVKVSDEKSIIWSEITSWLSDIYDVSVITPNKMLEINLNGKNFKLNLSETRQKKA